MRQRLIRAVGGTGLTLAVLPALATAQFQDNTTQIPQGSPGNNSPTENVDFGDVDGDGDWDAVFADGGDLSQDQSRIWINMGGLQGGTVGFFQDETSARFPAVNLQSRDIEFADIDNDGDLDIYLSNTSRLINQSNHWWVNLGGAQGGTPGFYQDQTAARWVGLGGSGSSIHPSQVLGSGGFIDYSCDCDFGDLDNDGDLDLVHSSYGVNFAGNVPTRLFLNDGAGFFSEFNPSGFQLSGATIQNGNPGLWCDGTQQNLTSNNNGTFCDIANDALDIDVGDVDGDFDLDILHGARNEVPRMFANRLDGSNLAPAVGGGALGFRDVTTLSFPANWATGGGHYEQEMGDLDGDGDLDIYGLNWEGGGGFGLDDVTLRNDGNGTYSDRTVLSGSGSDDNEGDFFDYDNDGDLDLFVANFSGQDRLYRNNNNGGSTFSYTNVTGGNIPGSSSLIALDADCCDVDSDGDYDVFVANDQGARNIFLKNLSNVPDTHAPYIPHVEQAPDRTPGAAPTVVRAQVYDNAPYYITWYNPTQLEISVNGGASTFVPMRSSAGQIFRGEIDGNLAGEIAYRVVSEDEYGNQGLSDWKSYTACVMNRFCSSTTNSTGSPALMDASGGCVVAANNLVLTAAPVPNQPGLFFYSSAQANGGNGVPFGNGLRCIGGGGAALIRLPVVVASGNVMSYAVDMNNLPSNGQITPGSTWNFQAWFRDPMGGGAAFNLSDGLEIQFQ